MKIFRSSSRKAGNFGKSEIIKVEFSPLKTLYKHPEIYTVPFNRTTFLTNDDQIEEKIRESKELCSRNKPYVRLPRRVHDQHSLQTRIREVQSIACQIEKEVQNVSDNFKKYFQG